MKKTRIQLSADVSGLVAQAATLLPDNIIGDITPADVRAVITSLANVAQDLADSASLLILEPSGYHRAVSSYTNAPPASPADGDRHLVGTAPTGAWAGHALSIAQWGDGQWNYTTTVQGDIIPTTAGLLYQRSGSNASAVRYERSTVRRMVVAQEVDTPTMEAVEALTWGIPSGRRMAMEATLIYEASTVFTGLKLALDGDVTSNITIHTELLDNAGSLKDIFTDALGVEAAATSVPTHSRRFMAYIHAVVEPNATNGVLTLYAGRGGSSGTITLHPGSNVIISEIA